MPGISMNRNRSSMGPLREATPRGTRIVLSEPAFIRMIAIERKRTERSSEPFLLMLVETSGRRGHQTSEAILMQIASVLASKSRETDVVGWYEEGRVLGVMFTGLPAEAKDSLLSPILTRVKSAIENAQIDAPSNEVTISFHFFPDDWGKARSEGPFKSALYLDLVVRGKRRGTLLAVKRFIDIAGSALLLLFCAPLFIVIALAIKVTSKGPVLFKQQRVGQYGRQFTFLKFRSMVADSDHSVHQEFVTELITGDNCSAEPETVYKLRNDKRITPVGRFLRRTSLDELPQLLNVLRGEMSLVGPRPAIPYELAAYQTWHRRRVIEAKPGITGAWQVAGRSRVKFDDMVRMDLRYAMSWTPWLDLKILLRTPLAVIRGTGAY